MLICTHCKSESFKFYKHIFRNQSIHCLAKCNKCRYRKHVNIEKYLHLATEEIVNKPKIKKELKIQKKKTIILHHNELRENTQKLSEKLAMALKEIDTLKKSLLKPSNRITEFYRSDEWQRMRYKVIRMNPRKCMACFATNIELHVDHIKPISKYWHLRLDIDNLQVLCRNCNMGKSNLDETDFRPSN